MSLTGRSSNIICDWINLCRDIPVKMFKKRIKFEGPDVIIQVDQCLLRGSRKNHKGNFYFIIKYNFILNINYKIL